MLRLQICQKWVILSSHYKITTSDFVYVRGKNVTNVGSIGNRTRNPSHARRHRRPLSHGVNRHLTYLSWYPWCFSIHYNIKLATNSASWLYYVSLVLGRERQYRSLNTITCEPRPFSIKFKKNNRLSELRGCNLERSKYFQIGISHSISNWFSPNPKFTN